MKQMGPGRGLGGDVLGQLEMHRARALFRGQTKRLAHQVGNVAHVDDLLRELRDGFHHADDIQDLEAALLAALDRLLAGDHDQGHTPELRVRRGGHEVGGPRTESGQAHAGFSGQTAVGGRHESGALFVAGQYQLDGRGPEGFEQIQVFFSGNAEHVLHTFVLQGANEQIGCFDIFEVGHRLLRTMGFIGFNCL